MGDAEKMNERLKAQIDTMRVERREQLHRLHGGVAREESMATDMSNFGTAAHSALDEREKHLIKLRRVRYEERHEQREHNVALSQMMAAEEELDERNETSRAAAEKAEQELHRRTYVRVRDSRKVTDGRAQKHAFLCAQVQAHTEACNGLRHIIGQGFDPFDSASVGQVLRVIAANEQRNNSLTLFLESLNADVAALEESIRVANHKMEALEASKPQTPGGSPQHTRLSRGEMEMRVQRMDEVSSQAEKLVEDLIPGAKELAAAAELVLPLEGYSITREVANAQARMLAAMGKEEKDAGADAVETTGNQKPPTFSLPDSELLLSQLQIVDRAIESLRRRIVLLFQRKPSVEVSSPTLATLVQVGVGHSLERIVEARAELELITSKLTGGSVLPQRSHRISVSSTLPRQASSGAADAAAPPERRDRWGVIRHLDLDATDAEGVALELKLALSAHLGRLADLFRGFDTDKSGTITKFEFRRALYDLGYDGDAAAADSVFNMADRDGCGQVDFDELSKMLSESSLAPASPPSGAGGETE